MSRLAGVAPEQRYVGGAMAKSGGGIEPLQVPFTSVIVVDLHCEGRFDDLLDL